MTQNNDTIALILQIKKILNAWQQQAQAIVTDPNVLHWQKVNIESFTSVIVSLGLNPTTLRRARDNYADLSEKNRQRLSYLANEINNLEAGMKLGPMPADIAQATARDIEEQCKELKPDIDRLLYYHKSLAQGSMILKEKLNFHSLLPQARQQAIGKKKSLFETGYTIYLTITDDREIKHNEHVVNMFSYFNRASQLLDSISRTQIPPLPEMATSFINQQLNLCREGCNEVKYLITFVSDYFQTEINHIKSFEKELAQLKKKSITALLLEIPSQTEIVGRCIQNFTHKKFLLDDIQNTNLLLSLIEDFHNTLTHAFLPYLSTQVGMKNGLLNPQTLAHVWSRKYFTGFSGFWHIVRMLLSFSPQAIISRDELQNKLTESIKKCSFFFTEETIDTARINHHADTFFSTYRKPFPHDELVTTMKRCILAYAMILEKVFTKYKTKNNLPDGGAEPDDSPPLGRLAGKIEIQTVHFKKYRLKYEK